MFPICNAFKMTSLYFTWDNVNVNVVWDGEQASKPIDVRIKVGPSNPFTLIEEITFTNHYICKILQLQILGKIFPCLAYPERI